MSVRCRGGGAVVCKYAPQPEGGIMVRKMAPEAVPRTANPTLHGVVFIFFGEAPPQALRRRIPGHYPSPGAAQPPPHAVFAAFSPSFVSTASRIRNFWIFPVTVIGNSSTNST